MRWEELQRRQPRLGARVRERLVDPGVLLAVTIRRDGSPRLSPVEPFVLDGRLWLSMLWGSRKASDLRRDPRLLLHGIVTDRDGRDGEVKVRGTAREEGEPGPQRRYADAVAQQLGWSPEVGRFHLFEVDLDDVVSIRYGDDGDQYVARWPAGAEFVRRGTSATTVGPAEPVHDLLD